MLCNKDHPEIYWLNSELLLSLWISWMVLVLSVLIVCLPSAVGPWVGGSTGLSLLVSKMFGVF